LDSDYPSWSSNEGFGDFSNLAALTSQSITGGHSLFQQDRSKQNLIKLPGNPGDYTITVNFSNSAPDTLGGTTTTIMASGLGTDDFIPGISIATVDVERLQFAVPLDSKPVGLFGSGGVAVEALQLASQSSVPASATSLRLGTATTPLSRATAATSSLSRTLQQRAI